MMSSLSSLVTGVLLAREQEEWGDPDAVQMLCPCVQLQPVMVVMIVMMRVIVIMMMMSSLVSSLVWGPRHWTHCSAALSLCPAPAGADCLRHTETLTPTEMLAPADTLSSLSADSGSDSGLGPPPAARHSKKIYKGEIKLVDYCVNDSNRDAGSS